ncbi:DUF397 domain-containing protein [Streptomyces sp. NPDC056500]|uniref:DUF397 domain-containing protein n=1 Tax=Streptomyces sp. NPDC056500 TaxID=3345840 RepID=UPI0036C351E5
MNSPTRATDLASECAWFKSSYSGGTGNSCVEVASLADQVGIRDSKDRNGFAIVVPATTWSTFVAFVVH